MENVTSALKSLFVSISFKHQRNATGLHQSPALGFVISHTLDTLEIAKAAIITQGLLLSLPSKYSPESG